MGSDNEPLELDVYMRAFVPDAAQRRQEAMLERMRDLADRGKIDDLSVTRWSNQVSVTPDLDSDNPAGEHVYRELDAATEDTTLSIEPFFRERRGPKEDRQVISLPVICVVVRSDETVAGIYPCSADDSTYSVTDCLDALEAGENVANVTEDMVLDPQPM
jgi:hypothetical protein